MSYGNIFTALWQRDNIDNLFVLKYNNDPNSHDNEIECIISWSTKYDIDIFLSIALIDAFHISFILNNNQTFELNKIKLNRLHNTIGSENFFKIQSTVPALNTLVDRFNLFIDSFSIDTSGGTPVAIFSIQNAHF